jgi:hypothetical protein
MFTIYHITNGKETEMGSSFKTQKQAEKYAKNAVAMNSGRCEVRLNGEVVFSWSRQDEVEEAKAKAAAKRGEIYVRQGTTSLIDQ